MPTHGLGPIADACKSVCKRFECPIGHAVVSNAVLRIGATGLGANRASAEHLGKVQACLVLGNVIHELLAIGRRQILIAAEHGDRNARLVEHRTQMVGKLAGQAASIDPHRCVEHLARQLNARKAQLSRHADAFLDGPLRKVVQTHTRSNSPHVIHIPYER